MALGSQAYTAYRSGQGALSIKLWEKALPLAKKLGVDHPFYSITLRNLGLLHYFTYECGRDYEKSRRYFEEELALLTPLGPDYPDLAFTLHYLGSIATVRGRYEEAWERYQRALAIGIKYPLDSQLAVTTKFFALVPLLQLRRTRQFTDLKDELKRSALEERSPAKAIGTYLQHAYQIYSVGFRAKDQGPYRETAVMLMNDAITLPGDGQQFQNQRKLAISYKHWYSEGLDLQTIDKHCRELERRRECRQMWLP